MQHCDGDAGDQQVDDENRLGERMIDAADPAEKLRIREELTRGFYGGKADA